jgi:integrase
MAAVLSFNSDATGDLGELIEDYLVSCQARGLSRATMLKNKGPVLRDILLPWCREHGLTRAEDLSEKVLNRWSIAIRQRPGRQQATISPETIRTYVKLANAFLTWLRQQEELAAPVRLPLPRVPRRRVDVLSPNDVARIADATMCDRDRAIVRTLWETGCRVGELLGLRLDDLAVRNGRRMLRVRARAHGGGSKTDDRWVPAPDVFALVKRYIKHQRSRETDSDLVFLSRERSARTGLYEPLQRKGVALMLAAAAERAGLGDRHVHPHLFRHSAATWWRQRAMDPLLIAHILGHSSLSMLMSTYDHGNAEQGYLELARLLAEEGRR